MKKQEIEESFYKYDNQDRLIYRKDPNNEETSMTYDENGNMTLLKRDFNTVKMKYNNKNRLIESVSLPNMDWGGDAIYEDDEISTKKYKYDEEGRLILMKDDDGFCTEYEYDEKGNIIIERLASGRKSNKREKLFFYDEDNNLIRERGFDGTELAYEYDKNKNIVSIQTTFDESTNPRKPKLITVERIMKYDKKDRLMFREDECGEIERFEYQDKYDERGNLIYRKTIIKSAESRN